MTNEERIAILETNQESMFNTIDEMKEEVKDIRRLTVAIERLATKVDTVSDKVSGIDERLDAIEQAPAKKWEKAKETIWIAILTGAVGTLIGALITALASK